MVINLASFHYLITVNQSCVTWNGIQRNDRNEQEWTGMKPDWTGVRLGQAGIRPE